MSEDEKDYMEDEYGEGEYEEDADNAEELKRMSMADFGPSPFKAALMAGLGDGKELSQGSPIKKSSVALKQKHFGQPIMKIESIRGNLKRTPVNRIGEFQPDEDDYDDGVGADLSELVFKAVDNKASNVLVRTRGNRLTKKQADVKASRIASKAK